MNINRPFGDIIGCYQHPVNTLFALRDAERSLDPLVIGKKGFARRTIGKDKEAKQSERDGGE